MSGEYINANSIDEYWKELKNIYLSRAKTWKDLSLAEYEEIERSERTDSDNEYNRKRLGQETKVIDIANYKYLPGRIVAYHIRVIHQDGSSKDYYFQIDLKEEK